MTGETTGLGQNVSSLTESQAERLEHFAMDIAERGCRIVRARPPGQSRWTCIDEQNDAHRAQRGEPSVHRWGSDGATGEYRDRVARGESLCRGCRAQRVLEGVYVLPGNDHAV